MNNIKSILSLLALSFFCLAIIGCKSKEERAMEVFEKAMDEGMREYEKTMDEGMQEFEKQMKKLEQELEDIDIPDFDIPDFNL